MRVLKKLRKYFLLISGSVFILSNTLSVFAGNNVNSLSKASGLKKIPKLESESAIVTDAKSGAVLLAKNPDKKQFPASITKVMTALLVLEKINDNCDDCTIVCSRNAVMSIERGSSHIGIVPDEELHIRDALNAMLLNSANEVSNALAEYVSGDLDDFAELMTERAKELGCKNTHFVNANGLHNDKHYTTAEDMSLILKEAMKHPLFREIVSTVRSYVPATNLTDEKRYLQNGNRMIRKGTPYYYEKCTGGKTGFTKKALHTLVNTANDGNLYLISAVLKSRGRPDKWEDTKKMFDFCFKNFRNENLKDDDKENDFTKLKALKTGDKSMVSEDSVLSYVEEEPTVTLPNDADVDDLNLVAEVESDDKTGRLLKLTYTYNDCVAGECHVNEKFIENTPVDTYADNGSGQIKSFNVVVIIISVAAVAVLLSVVYVFIMIRRKKVSDNFLSRFKGNKKSLDISLLDKK